MRIGTHHFKSYEYARRYYARQGLTAEGVQRKLATDEIAIGPPLLADKNVTCGCDSDGRYWITESEANLSKGFKKWADEVSANLATVKRPEPEHATRGQLVTRSIKAAGGYPPAKGWRVIGYDYTAPKQTASHVTLRTKWTVRVQVSRNYAHHMSGKVYTRILGRGATLEITLQKAIEKCRGLRATQALYDEDTIKARDNP